MASVMTYVRNMVLYSLAGFCSLIVGFGIAGAVDVEGPQLLPMATWAIACLIAALRRQAAEWATMVLFPLALVCVAWLAGGYPRAEDSFGIGLALIQLFLGLAVITGATGVALLSAAGAWRQPSRIVRA